MSNTSRFIVGKQYIYGESPVNIYTCEYVAPNGILVSWDNKQCHCFARENLENYKEYSPPVVHKRWVHFYRYTNGKVLSFTNEHPVPAVFLGKHLGSIPVEFTERV